ncbi:hypothetical protein B7495_04775 [Cryobacterium sp. LW097]|uniref:hypothetical protein n=1 Tax=Cryobacterium sp. LW097 TaxID=1978566 RepID=UPI000B4DC7F5|nr:hypothetical protein [Cryobacterium sp. LW097]ASD21488.1 hypothetical protein B7495_04775 [Cryobacterium sp. LW097]
MTFIPTNLEVIRLRASQGESSSDHATWSIAFDPEFLGEDSEIRVVIGSLHVGGSGGWADISVGSFFLRTQDVPSEELAALIAASDAAETLYDFARSHLHPLLAMIGSDAAVPRQSPDVTIAPFEPEDEDEEETTLVSIDA